MGRVSNRKQRKINAKKIRIKRKKETKRRDEKRKEIESFIEEIKNEPVEIQVAGFGFCTFENMEDANKQLTWCKNGIWKFKGDKGVDDEGNELVSDDEDLEETFEDMIEKSFCL